MSNALLDKDFLRRMDEWLEKEVYVKIISLDFAENPRTEIQGVATGGSINVDGSSAVRRTCSLNMITSNSKVNELDWALETKFKLEIGLKNYVNPNYENIIWFPQGTYIITSFGMTANSGGFSISLQGKDKMCMLDGTVGGSIFASHDFGKLEVRYKDGTVEFEPILIYDIIKNAVHEYALEPYENIIINDLDDCAVELLEYRAQNTKAILYDIDYGISGRQTQLAFEGNPIYDELYQLEPGQASTNKPDHYLVKLIERGDTIGYRLTDLTFPGGQDLILGAGSSITQLLDAIIQVLGEFEYFYDLQGRFVFQRKKIYYNVSWNNAITNEKETYYDSVENGSANAYTFTKGILIESYNNKPELNNIKNDYTIWGNMIAVDGAELPAHLRCAIDDKPTYYYPLLDEAQDDDHQPLGRELWATESIVIDERGHELQADVICDWRELIYRMAYDYSKSDAKILQITKEIANTSKAEELTELKRQLTLWNKTWDTKYSAYYTDILDFWRILYNPALQIEGTDEEGNPTKIDNPWATNGYWNDNYVNYEDGILYLHNHTGIPFWFDFCDDAYLEKYKPANIGRRPKVVNDSEVKAIFYEEIPNVLFVDPLKTQPYTDTQLSYVRLNITGGMSNYFQISTQGKSAKETLDNLLYNHTYYCESITLSCIPIYYLEPNVRIAVFDDTSGINGEYIIKSFSLQLAYNGSMSITATKAEDLIL